MRTSTVLFIAACSAHIGCASDTTTEQAEQSVSTAGALIKVEMTSDVAVLLDDIPAGTLREAAAADALGKPPRFWTDRAARQMRLLNYRLVFRANYHPTAHHKYGPLPLPDQSVWNFQLVGTPHRVSNVNGHNHDSIIVTFKFDTVIVTDADSPDIVDPDLGTIGGTTDELFTLPTDPDLLLERTGFACMDEDEYPPNAVFEENTWYFFDDSCKAGDPVCHITAQPTENCKPALRRHVGAVDATLHFTRVPYNRSTANDYRVGTITNSDGADLAVVRSAMVDEHRTLYRFFEPGACELEEGVIANLGWRRLITFSAVVQNNGTDRVHIGDVSDPSNPWVASNAFEFSQCHGHYHFSHYGNFNYNGAAGAKRAFCLEDTSRFHNDETTPLTAEHNSCQFQGIGAGWGDEYQLGIPGQWVDITDVDTKNAHTLTFDANPDKFLCEGEPVLDANGNLIFDPTSFKDSQGRTVSRIRCNMPSNWHSNNVGTVSVSSPGGSYVTDPCRGGEIGANRDCGFTAQTKLRSCASGSTVTLTCKNTGVPQALRICEKSAALGVGVACTLRDSIANQMIEGPTQVSFACPAVRDQAGAGGYSLYTASVVPSQGSGSVSCTGF